MYFSRLYRLSSYKLLPISAPPYPIHISARRHPISASCKRRRLPTSAGSASDLPLLAVVKHRGCEEVEHPAAQRPLKYAGEAYQPQTLNPLNPAARERQRGEASRL